MSCAYRLKVIQSLNDITILKTSASHVNLSIIYHQSKSKNKEAKECPSVQLESMDFNLRKQATLLELPDPPDHDGHIHLVVDIGLLPERLESLGHDAIASRKAR